MSTTPPGSGAPGHEQLRRLRIRTGLSQRELAAQAGISVRTLRYLERGAIERPHASSIHRLAAALGVSTADLSALLDSTGGAGRAGVASTASAPLRIGVLGPLSVHRGPVAVEVGSAMQRNLLGLLAIQPGQTVGAQEIVEVLWEGEPPRTCVQLVHTHVGQLRRLLEPGRGSRTPGRVLRHVTGGYRLDLEPDQLDLSWSGDLAGRARQARSTGATESAFQLYREAASYWRGPVLAGADARLCGHPAAVAVARLRIATVLEWADVALSLARYEQVIGPLQHLGAEEPLHEGLTARLMVALAGDGQQAAALRLYGTMRHLLDEQLGVTPGAELQAAHLRVLRGQLPVATRPTVDLDRAAGGEPSGTDAGAAAGTEPAAAVPAQLPTDVAAFTGRDADIRALNVLLPAEGGGSAPARVVTVAGMGGVGKTALAVRWAHLVRDRFPDGQLYVNLRGHSTEGPLRPIDALAGFLLGLGVPAVRIPTDEAQAAAMYRSRLSGRRVLILLDNAISAEQVRPLLPAGPGVVAVVTSRDLLTGLIARDGAQLLSLDALPPRESAALLENMLGAARAGAEPEAVAGLARLCAHLPLALRIAAANLAGRPRYRIADYVAKLATGDRLAALSVDGDADTAVRATFELSCDALPDPERRMFRLLGLVGVPDFTAASAAALAETDPAEAERTLDRLTSRHLVDEHQPGRYALHDLLRLYAAELAEAELDAAGRRAATARFAGHYEACAAAASQLLYRNMLLSPELDAPALAATAVEPLRDAAAARAWLETERANLVALVVHLAEYEHHRAAWELAALFNGYFTLRSNAVDWRVVAEAALSAARAGGDLTAQAAAELHLGMAENVRCRLDESAGHYERSAALAERVGWIQCRAVAINNLAGTHWTCARIDQTVDCLTEALALHRRAGRRTGEAVTLANLATALLERRHDLTGEAAQESLELAVGLMTDALALHVELGDRRNEGDTLRLFAEMARDTGDLGRARELAEQALAVARETQDERFEGGALNLLATIRVRLGDADSGLALHRRALTLAQRIDDPRLHAQFRLGLADSHARLGRADDAFLEVQDALAIGRQIGSRLVERQVRRILALIPGRSAADLGLSVLTGRPQPPVPADDARTHVAS
jgi:DNA-binding SARP family transcriptional activator/tetratricopeptide (TPR) repeat protein/DNA-binding XRE family transcriptional regulator